MAVKKRSAGNMKVDTREKMTNIGSVFKQKLTIRNQALKEFMAEFLGTFILMLMGDASVAQYVLGREKLHTDFLSVNIAWGVAVTMGVYSSLGVSGGHINPAVSVSMAVLGRLPWRKVPVYMAGQYLGAIFASVIVYAVYFDALSEWAKSDPDMMYSIASSGIWTTYPQSFLRIISGFGDQVVGTAVLLLCVMAITDEQNCGAPKRVIPVMVGMAVLGIGLSFGFNCGYAINPARDLGPRIFNAMAGWGRAPFRIRDYAWFWVPVVGPHIGAIIGAWFYWLCISLHHTPQKTDQTEQQEEKETVIALE